VLTEMDVHKGETSAISVDCRCVLVQKHSHKLLAMDVAGEYRLPRIYITAQTRIALEAQKAIKAQWELDVFVLEISAEWSGAGARIIAELLTAQGNSDLEEVASERVVDPDFSEEEARQLELLFGGSNKILFSRPGWIDEAFAWMESATREAFSSKGEVEQWNAGGGFVLLRAHSDAGRHYWLKAIDGPNLHEFAITRLLSGSYPTFLPKIVAMKDEWNAWLMEDAGAPISEPFSSAELFAAAERFASFQNQTIGATSALLESGAIDLRLPALMSHIDQVIDYLMGAMKRQRSTKAAPLGPSCLLKLGETLHRVCIRLEDQRIPDALIHNDLSAGNILSNGVDCVFTDWSEAAVGNPFLACERLCQLNRTHADCVRNAYRQCWSHRLCSQSLDDVLTLTPLVAIYAYLYGRGDWLRRPESPHPSFDSYARSLARHMDRAAEGVAFREALCR
jgi:hypothetical protein